MRGVVILAIGEGKGSVIYGNLAFNLAMSLKTNCKIDITLLYSKNAISQLTSDHLSYFDKFIEVPKQCFMQQGKPQYQKAKTYLYWLSPYDETIYIDADALWLPYYTTKNAKWRNNDESYFEYVFNRDINELFDTLNGQTYTGAVGGILDVATGKATQKLRYTHWNNHVKETLLPYYKLTKGLLPQYQTTFMYFDKSDLSQQVFKKALEIYEDEKKPCNRWANGFPDEFCFNVAACIVGIQPVIDFMPVYVEFVEGRIVNTKSLHDRFSIFTNCGAKVSESVKLRYNSLARKYSELHNLPSVFYHTYKRDVLPERING